MLSGLEIPFSLVAGANLKCSLERADLVFVTSSHVMQFKNFIINLAAMLTFCPITGMTIRCNYGTRLGPGHTRVLMPLGMSHHSTEGYASGHSYGIVTLQFQVTQCIEYIPSCPQGATSTVFMASVREAKDAEECATLGRSQVCVGLSIRQQEIRQDSLCQT